MSQAVTVISIAPYSYIHVLNTNTNVTSVVEGPARYTREDHERIVHGPATMVKIPPRHFMIVANPCVLDPATGTPVRDNYNQFKLRHGDIEVRTSATHPEPFPLMPGEALEKNITQLEIVEKNTALRLRAVRDFTEMMDVAGDLGDLDASSDDGMTLVHQPKEEPADDVARTVTVERVAGDEWLFRGPATYTPRVEAIVVGTVESVVIKANEALRLKAVRATHTSSSRRKAGEEWLVRDAGSYLPTVDEQVVGIVPSHIITEKLALHLSAQKTFTDVYGIRRRAGEEWLVTHTMSDHHIPDVYEDVVGQVRLTTLTNRQYAVILDPYNDEGVQKLGTKKIIKGEASFFLLPGETLESGIEDIFILADDEALLLQAREEYDGKKPGDRWMAHGPIEYIPPIEVKVLEKRVALPLDANEGVYVRDLTTGQVRAVIGETYMLKANEELWKKELPADVEKLLAAQRSSGQAYVPAHGKDRVVKEASPPKKSFTRDKTSVVNFRVPHNCAIQLYNYKSKKSRISLGPDMVMLMPDEQFSVISLSGDKPKRPNVITSLALQLGPDFMTDILVVETSDHARLRLTLAYNWHFDVGTTDEDSSKIFAVRDFTGDACKAMGSRVRGAVSGVTFDVFHKNSIKIIRASVFGMSKDGKVGDEFRFGANNLVITNIDVQSVEPVDAETRTSLQRSVQMAIQITTDSQEAAAKHSALREEEEAKGTLLQQRLENEAKAEDSKRKLLQLQAESAAVQTSGQAKAEAQARAESMAIEGKAAVSQAELEAQAMGIKFEQEMKILKARQAAEIEHQRALAELEILRNRQLAEIESSKFKMMVDAIGTTTIESIARAGPEMQAKLLGGLGIKSMMITDGKNPINLFQTAAGMVNAPSLASATADGSAETA